MKGDLGKLDEIVAMKKDFKFRCWSTTRTGSERWGRPAPERRAFRRDRRRGRTVQYVRQVDGGIGAFVSSEKYIVDYLRYNMRSQTYAKALPMPMVKGALKRLDMIRKHPEFKDNLWTIVHALQSGFRKRGFDIGGTCRPLRRLHERRGGRGLQYRGRSARDL